MQNPAHIGRHEVGDQPALADLTVASSLVKKAIRRGDEANALAAARALWINAPHRMARSLVRVAVDEIGLANLALVETVLRHVEVGARSWNWTELARIVVQLAASAKCHGASDVMAIARHSPKVSITRDAVLAMDATDRITFASLQEHSLEERAVAIRFLAPGPRGDDPCRTSKRLARDFLTAMRSIAHDAGQIDVAECAFWIDRSEGALGLALLLAHRSDDAPAIFAETAPSPVTVVGGIPSYAFDRHTLVGAWALTLAAKNDVEIKSWLKHAVRWWENRICALAYLLEVVEGGAAANWRPMKAATLLNERRADGHECIRKAFLEEGVHLMREKIGAIDRYRLSAYDMRFASPHRQTRHKFSGSPGSSSSKKIEELNDGDA